MLTRWYVLYDDAGTPKREIVTNLIIKDNCVYFTQKNGQDAILPLLRIYKIAKLKNL